VAHVEHLPERARAVLQRAKLVALDVDGVMTDGKVVYSGREVDDVHEEQRFDVQDGLALRWLSNAGIKVAWITGRGCAVTEHRAKELEIDALEIGVGSKRDALEALQKRFAVVIEETVAMGDDLPDLGLRARAGFFAAPSNARAEIKERSDLVIARAGGDGAVRELVEIILRAQNRWQALIDQSSR
jgi:3-deoxy-D-manno-octulosonate 8-phosphate phosphatase (KDO 8-P phosphatase)